MFTLGLAASLAAHVAFRVEHADVLDIAPGAAANGSSRLSSMMSDKTLSIRMCRRPFHSCVPDRCARTLGQLAARRQTEAEGTASACGGIAAAPSRESAHWSRAPWIMMTCLVEGRQGAPDASEWWALADVAPTRS